MKTMIEQFRPSPELEIHIDDPRFVEPVGMVDDYLSQLGSTYFKRRAEGSSVTSGGMQYSIVGDQNRSRSDVIVMPAPFGNGHWAQHVARAEAISYLTEQSGVVGEDGHPLGVLLTASPSMKSRYNLQKDERRQIKNGNFEPASTRQLELTRSLGFSGLRGVFYSQSSTFASSFVERGVKNQDVHSVIVGDPPHVENRSLLSLGVGFAREGAQFMPEVEAEGIQSVTEIFHPDKNEESVQFEKGVLYRGKENYALAKGFSRGRLQEDLAELSNHAVASTVLHASDSLVSSREAVKSAFSRTLQDARIDAKPGTLQRVEVVGANHGFGDRVGRFAILCAANLSVE